MTIYKPEGAEGFELCHPVDSADFTTLRDLIDGTPRAATWHPIAVTLVRKDRRRSLRPSDAPSTGTSQALVFKRAARDALEDELARCGEFLPLTCDDAELFVFNATTVLDALDEPRSAIDRFASGKIMHIRTYAFIPARLGDVQAFKIPNVLASPTFVGERVVERWRAAGLHGLDFTKLL